MTSALPETVKMSNYFYYDDYKNSIYLQCGKLLILSHYVGLQVTKRGRDKDDLFSKAAKRVGSKTHMEYHLLWTATVMAFSRH